MTGLIADQVRADVMAEINQFPLCPTPAAWIDVALENQELLLIDHANWEKKAASTAMNLLYRCIDRDDLLKKMSQKAPSLDS